MAEQSPLRIETLLAEAAGESRRPAVFRVARLRSLSRSARLAGRERASPREPACARGKFLQIASHIRRQILDVKPWYLQYGPLLQSVPRMLLTTITTMHHGDARAAAHMIGVLLDYIQPEDMKADSSSDLAECLLLACDFDSFAIAWKVAVAAQGAQARLLRTPYDHETERYNKYDFGIVIRTDESAVQRCCRLQRWEALLGVLAAAMQGAVRELRSVPKQHAATRASVDRLCSSSPHLELASTRESSRCSSITEPAESVGSRSSSRASEECSTRQSVESLMLEGETGGLPAALKQVPSKMDELRESLGHIASTLASYRRSRTLHRGHGRPRRAMSGSGFHAYMHDADDPDEPDDHLEALAGLAGRVDGLVRSNARYSAGYGEPMEQETASELDCHESGVGSGIESPLASMATVSVRRAHMLPAPCLLPPAGCGSPRHKQASSGAWAMEEDGPAVLESDPRSKAEVGMQKGYRHPFESLAWNILRATEIDRRSLNVASGGGTDENACLARQGRDKLVLEQVLDIVHAERPSRNWAARRSLILFRYSSRVARLRSRAQMVVSITPGMAKVLGPGKKVGDGAFACIETETESG